MWQHFHLQSNTGRFSYSFDLPSCGPLTRSTIMNIDSLLRCKTQMQSETRILPLTAAPPMCQLILLAWKTTAVVFKTQRCQRPEEILPPYGTSSTMVSTCRETSGSAPALLKVCEAFSIRVLASSSHGQPMAIS